MRVLAMSTMTLVEKILAAHAGAEVVRAGEEISVAYDAMLVTEDDAALCAPDLSPRDASRLVVIPDHLPGADVGAGLRYRQLREFAARCGAAFVALGRGGLAPAEFIERGHALPGRVVVASRRAIGAVGAVGCLGLHVDGARARAALESGSVQVMVPGSLRVRVNGAPARWSRGRDVALALLNQLDAGAGFADLAVEIDGAAVERMDPFDRLELTGCAVAAGARASFCPVDEAAQTWLRARSAAEPRPFARDRDATFGASVDVDVEGLEPLVRKAGDARARRVTELAEVPVDVVVIGGDAGGRIEDLRVASRLLREHPVDARVQLIVIPATSRCLLHAVTEGILTVFLRAGATVLPASAAAAGCIAQALAAGARVLETGFPGAGDEAAAERHWCGAAVAAASAVMGRIAHPDEVMRSRRESV